MVTSEPEFWGSWKGRVLKAIVIDGARRWNEIRDLTGLSAYSLNIALNELEMAGALAKTSDGAYWVDDETYFEYKEFFEEQESTDELAATVPVKFSDEKQRNLAEGNDVRGIIVANEIDDRMKYAAYAAGSVEILAYKIMFELTRAEL